MIDSALVNLFLTILKIIFSKNDDTSQKGVSEWPLVKPMFEKYKMVVVSSYTFQVTLATIETYAVCWLL